MERGKGNPMSLIGMAQNQPVSLKSMRDFAAAKYKIDPKQIDSLMNEIAWHETGGTMNPETQQRINAKDEHGNKIKGKYVDGQGKGLFQFEKMLMDEEGVYGQAGGMTARNRLANYYATQGIDDKHEDFPQWLNQEGMRNPEIGFDASKVSADQQRMLFIGNVLMGKGRNFKNIGEGERGKWWLNNHYIGNENSETYDADRVARLNSFNASQKDYYNKFRDNMATTSAATTPQLEQQQY